MGNTLSPEDFTPIATELMPEAENARNRRGALYIFACNARRLFKLVRGVYRMSDVTKVPVSVKSY
ncbi:hypothetical protein [Escherichia coli]|uniref:hypothetical protein n=1 Tax=Escherichia coli TaxID=562 RepID=UPI002FCCFF87